MRDPEFKPTPVHLLKVGNIIDLEGDVWADPSDPKDSRFRLHPEFEFEVQVVAAIELETYNCVRIDLESGPSFGFPVDHKIPCHPTDINHVTILASMVSESFDICGSCDHWHPTGFNGDCRDDYNRFTTADLENYYGQDGWTIGNPEQAEEMGI